MTSAATPATGRSPALPPLALGTFAIGSDAFVIAGILPDIADDLDVSVAAAAQMVTVFALTYALAAPVLSATLSRLPRRTLLLVALSVFVLANLGSAAAPNFAVLAITRVVAALGAGLFTPNAAAAAALSVPPERRGRALALVFVGLSVANVVGVPLGTLVGNAFSWRVTLALVAAVGLVALAGIAVLLHGLPPAAATPLKSRLALLGNRRVLSVLLSVLAGSVAGYSFYTYLAPEMAEFAGIPPTQLPVLFLVNGVVGVIGGQLGGRLADRFPVLTVMTVGFAAIAATLFTAPLLAQDLAGAIVVMILFALTTTVVYVPAQHRLSALAPTAATEVLALNSSALYLGITLAGVIGGALLANVSATAIPLAGGVFALIGLVLFASSYAGRDRAPATAGAGTDRSANR